MANYEDIAKNQKAIEDNFKLIKAAFVEIEKKILARRAEVVTAIQAEQAEEAAKLDSIIKTMQTFVTPEQQQQQQQGLSNFQV